MLRQYDYRCFVTEGIDNFLNDEHKHAQGLFREKNGTYLYIDSDTLSSHPKDGLYHILIRYPGITVGELIVDPSDSRIMEIRYNPFNVICQNGPYERGVFTTSHKWKNYMFSSHIEDISKMIREG